MPQAPVCTGLDRLVRGEFRGLAGKRVGLLVHPSSVDRDLRHAIDCIGDATDCTLVRLFGPEHGLRGSAQDMASVDADLDRRSGLPIVSLYGSTFETLSPRADDLADLDAIVFDLQDVGARYYTYIWTLLLTMRVASEAGVEVVVLDRPNPLGGAVIEGPAIEPGFESFVGLASLPNRHGLTAGEFARLLAARESLSCELTIVEMTGWKRSMWFDETGLPWVLPSPNMPTLETAVVYPGMCLVEGTEISEGRGTTRPFEFYGAPYIDGDALAEELAAGGLPGIRFRAMAFEPSVRKHANTACGGLQIHLTDRDRFASYRSAVAILAATFKLYPKQFEWRLRAYEFVDDIPAIDLLAGSSDLRTGIEAGRTLEALSVEWGAYERAFALEREPFLFYD